MLCTDVMKKNVVACSEGDSLHWCAQLMRDWKIGFLPVVDGRNRIIGILTDRDIAVRGVAENKPAFTEAREVMTNDPITCRADDTLRLAEDKMVAARKSRIAIVDEAGHCTGVISLSDIAQAENRRRTGELVRAVTRREADPAPGVSWDII
jgi:CBS domain-containing protein